MLAGMPAECLTIQYCTLYLRDMARTPNCKCGRFHKVLVWTTQAGVQHGCRYAAAMDMDAAIESAANRIEKATDARMDADHDYATFLRTGSEWRKARAFAAYELAYELENGTMTVGEAIARRQGRA